MDLIRINWFVSFYKRVKWEKCKISGCTSNFTLWLGITLLSMGQLVKEITSYIPFFISCTSQKSKKAKLPLQHHHYHCSPTSTQPPTRKQHHPTPPLMTLVQGTMWKWNRRPTKRCKAQPHSRYMNS